jgi:hypothetical protein
VRFTGSVDHRFRYALTKETRKFLDVLYKTSSTRHRTLNVNEALWRAQRGYVNRNSRLGDVDIEIIVENPLPYSASRMKPLQHAAREGRVNPTGIPALYLSNCLETAIAEVRPWEVGSYVSIGKFKLKRKLKVIDFSKEDDTCLGFYEKEPIPEQRTRIIWAQIGREFSMPVSDDPSTAHYVSTQIIAETFRQRAFDGIAYKSSLGAGLNVALFSLDTAYVVARSLYQIESVKFGFNKVKSSHRGKRV